MPGTLRPLPRSFYARDPRDVARDLLGAVVRSFGPEGETAGRILETEAYLGAADPACHAVAGRTRRTWHLFSAPGHAYIYRIYGLHWCLNASTEAEGVGSAVLIRAIEPLVGLDAMRRRRGPRVPDRDLARGPGRLCQALGLTGALDGHLLVRRPLVLATGDPVADADVVVTGRIGITPAADWPLRYHIASHPGVTPTPRALPRLTPAEGARWTLPATDPR